MKNLFMIFIAIMLISSCKDNSLLNGKTGDLMGQISDDAGNNLSGVKVEVKGISQTYLTDANGKFNIQNLPIGTYDIYFSKTGYDSTAIFGLYFLGENVFMTTSNIPLQHKTVSKCTMLTMQKLIDDPINLVNVFTYIDKEINSSLYGQTFVGFKYNKLNNAAYFVSINKTKDFYQWEIPEFNMQVYTDSKSDRTNAIFISKQILTDAGFKTGDSAYAFVSQGS
ncbi:MAG: carboxypeptidase-like regulatory domain-containing protein [Candidatus Kapabacteria bacterium]|nr:carboxypeptidase-like regulatory domain-containing protein [Candidatus Kapabacteria bacterium]